MYLKHFGFRQPPFAINPDPRFLYLSPKHQEALAHLLYGLGEGGGFVMLSGEVGTGKTTLCFSLLEQMGENVDVALILNPRLSAVELLGAVCDELHIAYPEECDSPKRLIDRLNQFLLANHARGRRTVAVIDEAQNLSVEVMEQIRLLTNLETPTTKLLQIVLVGQPELPALLKRPELRQVDQRITARYHLGALDPTETRHYIRHRLSVAGGSPQLFDAAAIRNVCRVSRGIPRLINVICDRALLGAYTLDRSAVDRRIVDKAYREVYAAAQPNAWISAAATALFLAVATASLLTMKPGIRGGPRPPDMPDSAQSSSASKPVAPPLMATDRPAEPPSVNSAQPAPEAKEALTFDVWLNDPAHREELALAQLVQRWRPGEADRPTNCGQLTALGLRCLRQQTDWDYLRRQNLPGILMLRGEGRAERAVLLIGTSDGQAEFPGPDGQTLRFPVLEVLSRWAGVSLVLWEPPSNRDRLAPGIESPAVVWLRERLAAGGFAAESAGDSRLFDRSLKSALMRFQESRGMAVDGIAGERTLAALSGVQPVRRMLSLSHHSDP